MNGDFIDLFQRHIPEFCNPIAISAVRAGRRLRPRTTIGASKIANSQSDKFLLPVGYRED